MTITSLTLTNPGAETGDTTGWTTYSGGGTFAVVADPNTGTYAFRLTGLFAPTTLVGQQVAVPIGSEAAIDADSAAFEASFYMKTGSGDSGNIYVQCYAADGTTLLGTFESPQVATSGYELRTVVDGVPSGTRFIRVGSENHRGGSSIDNRWDDFTLDFSDDKHTDYPGVFEPHASQIGAYAIATYPADEGRATQLPIIAMAAAETSNGLFNLYAHQLGAYALVREHGDRRELRAWTFKQDDHEFYGIQLGSGDTTLVWDKLTNQWCTWKSPEEVYWRAADVVDWEGYNVACDTESGKIWVIDPTGRLDYETTPITSIVVGYLTHRLRQSVPCYMAELALSEGQPPSGFDDGTVGIALRTSTDDGLNFVSHGEVTGEGIGEDITVRWYGLGLMKSPGMLFEITDTGYARRIDGLDIEITE